MGFIRVRLASAYLEETAQTVRRRMFTIWEWNHKLRFIVSSDLFAFFGSLLGFYISGHQIILNLSPTSVALLTTMFVVTLGGILLALID